MNRMQSLTAALVIVNGARLKTFNDNPGAWDFLWRVTDYLSEQSRAAFAGVFTPGYSDLDGCDAAADKRTAVVCDYAAEQRMMGAR